MRLKRGARGGPPGQHMQRPAGAASAANNLRLVIFLLMLLLRAGPSGVDVKNNAAAVLGCCCEYADVNKAGVSTSSGLSVVWHTSPLVGTFVFSFCSWRARLQVFF